MVGRFVDVVRKAMIDRGVDGQKFGLDVDSHHGIDLSHLTMTRDIFDLALRDKKIKECMEDLDLCEGDWGEIFDIMDLNADGEIQIVELVEGMVNLGGGARRVTNMATNGILRSMQRAQRDFELLLLKGQSQLLMRSAPSTSSQPTALHHKTQALVRMSELGDGSATAGLEPRSTSPSGLSRS